MPKPLTLLTKLDRFPPVVVRLLARTVTPNHSVRALLDHEIAASAGLTISEVRHLSRLTKWDDVTVSTLAAFTRGCRADLDDRDWLRKNAAYMASIRSTPRYLRKSEDWSSTFEPLIRILVRHDQNKTS